MPLTRSSSRKSAATSPEASPSAAGTKRKAESSPTASPSNKGKKPTSTPKKQKTIEEALPDIGKVETANSEPVPKDSGQKKDDAGVEINATNATDAPADAEMKDAENEQASAKSGITKADSKVDEAQSGKEAESKSTTAEQNEVQSSTNGTYGDQQAESTEAERSIVEQGAKDESTSKADASAEVGTTAKPTETKPAEGDAVEHSAEREKSTPSSILEKGIIYFFFRGRVGIDEPSDVNDIARSYIVLRPLPRGAKLTDGPIGDQNNLRVLALPKKVLPKSPKDRFMVFVEKSKVSLEDLKKEFLSASDYETKTAGTRHTPAATPIGEGVYALTSTGRETHLAYVLTIPKQLSEVQKDIGLEAKGSWATSVKNPQYGGPAQAQLPNDAKFSQEILDDFRSLRWGQLQPRHLEYENCQLLVIGHKDHSFAKATESEGKEVDAAVEIEKLGEEDERRVEHLEGDDTVFEDLNIDAKEYPSVQTTW